MSYGGAKAFAAAFGYLGIDARPVPAGDERTYQLASRYTSGDECLPARVTIGNFLKALELPDFKPERTALFMPTSRGPCRFGQYSPFLRHVLDSIGCEEVMIVSPTSANGYEGLGNMAQTLMKLGWWGLVTSDALRKLLHIYRPYETEEGAADRAHEESLDLICEAIGDRSVSMSEKLDRVVEAVEGARNKFKEVPVDFTRDVRLVGVVGEIFCRLSTFSNEDLIRKLEKAGGRAWLSDISEWIWYTNYEQVKNLRMGGKTVSLDMLGAKVKQFVQHRHEKKLLAPLEGEFGVMEEPHDISEIINRSYSYLPYHGVLGEMVLSVGKSIYMYEKGVDGIIDISPFTCMNGIVSESIYPRVSSDHDNIPMRVFYFDGAQSDLENDLAIFMELVNNYHRKKNERMEQTQTA